MNTNDVKKYAIELTESEVFALNEGLVNPVEEAASIGNNSDLFLEMAKAYLKERPSESAKVLDVVRNYTTINSVLLMHRSALLNVSSKAMDIIKTL